MIYYSREKKELIIPEGMGGLVPSGDFSQGMEAGRTAQAAEDAAKLTEITIEENGTYTPEYGYKKVVVDVEGGGGKISGPVAKMLESATTAADVYYYPPAGYDGMPSLRLYIFEYRDYWKSSGRTEGVAAGVAQQKALLDRTTITENGTYTRENGWSAVTVNVNQTPIAGFNCTLEGTFTLGNSVTFGYQEYWLWIGWEYGDWTIAQNYMTIDNINALDIRAAQAIDDSSQFFTFSAGTHTFKFDLAAGGLGLLNNYVSDRSIVDFAFGNPGDVTSSDIHIKISK